MGIEYEICAVNGRPALHLSVENNHIGTIWGNLELSQSDFERTHGIITILEDNKITAIIWGATKREGK